jgi:hypothetical protein
MSGIRLKDSETAVSTVVSAVLLLGIIVALLTVINVSYIPEWKTGAEQAHMADVYYDMSVLKSNMDILSVAAMNDPMNTMSFSNPVRAGGASIPLISPGRSSGVLGVVPGMPGMRIIANGAMMNYDSEEHLQNLGTLFYTSGNSYFVDQTYAYESGGLILAQGELAIMRQSPPIAIRRTDNSTNITIYVHGMQVSGPAKAISSNSIEEVRTVCDSSVSLYAEETVFTDLTLTVDTAYPRAWEDFFRREAANAGLTEGEYMVSNSTTSVVLSLQGSPGEDIKANIRMSSLEANFNYF